MAELKWSKDALNESVDALLKKIPQEVITPEDLQAIYNNLRPGNLLTLRQTEASIRSVCYSDMCLRCEVYDVLREMDRRSFLMKDLEWEFALLDNERTDTISVENAHFLFRSMHGSYTEKKWVRFLRTRPVPGSRITLAEIEVCLCDVPEEEDSEEDF